MPKRYYRAHEKRMQRVVSTGKSKLIGKTCEVMAYKKMAVNFLLSFASGPGIPMKRFFYRNSSGNYQALANAAGNKKNSRRALSINEPEKSSRRTFRCEGKSPEKSEPSASINNKNYFNLMHVYLDAIFNIFIYSDPRILKLTLNLGSGLSRSICKS